MHPLIQQLCGILHNEHFPSKLSVAYKAANISQDEPLFLHVEASLGSSKGPVSLDRILLVIGLTVWVGLLLMMYRVV